MQLTRRRWGEAAEHGASVPVPRTAELLALPMMRPTFVVRPLTVIAAMSALLALIALFPRVISIRTDSSAPDFATGDWFVADLGTNLPGAMMATIIVLVVGLIAATWKASWSAGLITGAGLALTGWSLMTLGLAEVPAQLVFDAAARPSLTPYSVTIRRDLGYGLIAATAVAGVACTIVGAAGARRDRGAVLNPWIAAVGAVAAVIAAAGPLIPTGSASLATNWTIGDGRPLLYVIGRLVQVGLLAFGGVVGFLVVRRWGLGVVVGAAAASVWLTLTALIDIGARPIGPGVVNPGEVIASTTPHAVTIAGAFALVGIAVIAIVLASDQPVRRFDSAELTDEELATLRWKR